MSSTAVLGPALPGAGTWVPTGRRCAVQAAVVFLRRHADFAPYLLYAAADFVAREAKRKREQKDSAVCVGIAGPCRRAASGCMACARCIPAANELGTIGADTDCANRSARLSCCVVIKTTL